jgi:PIN domain nuclease of toxin-antitoxin system
MRLLLDTHVLLWWLRDNPKLGPRSRAAIAAPGVELLVSIASFWEMSIKARNGKSDEPGSTLWNDAIAQGVTVLSLNSEHLRALEVLRQVVKHNDPFDHLILAQAKAERALLVTSDRLMRQYDVPFL